MAYQFLSTISGINTTFTGNSVYSNSTPNRTVKLDAVGLYLSRTSNAWSWSCSQVVSNGL